MEYPQPQHVAQAHDDDDNHDDDSSEEDQNWYAYLLSNKGEEPHLGSPALQAAARQVEAFVESHIRNNDNDDDFVGELEPETAPSGPQAQDEGAPLVAQPPTAAAAEPQIETVVSGPQVEDEGAPPVPPLPAPLSAGPPSPAPLSSSSSATTPGDKYSFQAAWNQGWEFRGLYLPASFPNARNAVVSARNLKDDPEWQASPLSQDTMLMEELLSAYFAFLTTGRIAQQQQQWRVLDPAVFQQVCQQFSHLGGSQPALERLGRPHVPDFVQFCRAYAHAEGKSGGFLFWMAPKKPNATRATREKKFLQLKKQKALTNHHHHDNKTPWWEQLVWYETPFVDITGDDKMLRYKLEHSNRKLPPVVAPPQGTDGAAVPPFAAARDGGGDAAPPALAPEGSTSPDDGAEGVEQGVAAPEGPAVAAPDSAPLPPRFISIGGYLYERKRRSNEALGTETEEEEQNRPPPPNLHAVETSSRAPLERGRAKQD